jgi:hypothetical protein
MVSSEESAWGMCTGTVDVSAARALAWMYHFMSYERCAVHVRANGDLMRLCVPTTGGNHSVFQVIELNVPAAKNRVLAHKVTWRRTNEDVLEMASTSIQDLAGTADYPTVMQAIDIGSCKFQPLADNACRVVMVGQGVARGWMPNKAMEYATKGFLSIVDELREGYERSGKAVDDELRAVFPPPPPLIELEGEQVRVVNRCLALEVGSGAIKWQALKSTSPLVSLSMMYTEPEGNQPRYAPSRANRIRERDAGRSSERKRELELPDDLLQLRSRKTSQRQPRTNDRRQQPTLARGANNLLRGGRSET